MIKNYILIAWRTLLKNKLFSAINILGLAVGLATCLLLTLFILDEKNVDQHHNDLDSIFRVSMDSDGVKVAPVSAPIANGLVSEIPEIIASARLLKFPNVNKYLLSNESKKSQFYESNGFYVDSTFFKIFTYDFVYGDPGTALNKPNSIVISEEIAQKLFGENDPIDQLIEVEIPYAKSTYTVGGVFNNKKNQSHIPANLFLSMRNSDVGGWVDQQSSWIGNNLFHTYIKLGDKEQIKRVNEKIPAFTERHIGSDLIALNIQRSYFLQPLKDIYLKSDFKWEIAQNGSMTSIYIFSAIAIFLLLIACINFMNLSTAQSEKRAKEVGMRKVLGAQKKSLILQFLSESFLLCFIALFIALLLILLFVPFFNNLTNKELEVFSEPSIVAWITGLALLTGLLSGLYPAFYLSSFRPIVVLKGILVNNVSAKIIRKSLVVFQFTISAVLILVSGIILQQMNFLSNQDLGFKKEQQLIIPFRNSSASEKFSSLKSELLNIPYVNFVSAGDSYPGKDGIISDNSFYAEGKTMDESVWTRYGIVHDDYIKTLGFELIAGRSFSSDSRNDSFSIIFNEKAISQLGYDTNSAIGRKVYSEFGDQRWSYEIIGVIKDFNFESLHQPINAYGLISSNQNQPNYLIANLSKGDYPKTIADIENSWANINPGSPFEYAFLDQDFERNYQSESQTSSVVYTFMFIAIFIACIGLFGLATFTTEQRRKEVGIRKVLGASVSSIVIMHLVDFLKLVIIALFIAFPLSYYFGFKWLEQFAFRIGINWKIFAMASLLALFIAAFTVSFQAIKAAVLNPIKTLKTE